MPLWKVRGKQTGGGGGGGAGCLIDVSAYPGADLGEKLQNAIDSMPASGGVLDCRCMSGDQTITSTVTVDKPIEIWFGAGTITCTASPSIHMAFLGDTTPGSVIFGAGIGVTNFVAPGGVTPIFLVECDNAILRDFQVQYSSGDNTNVGMLVRQGPSFFGRIRTHLENVLFAGANFQGSGVQFDVVFGILMIGCEVRGWNYGVQSIPNAILGGVTAFDLIQNRIFLNNTGVQLENSGDNYAFGNTIEGNFDYGVHALYIFNYSSVANHYEQFGVTPKNVAFEGGVDPFPRDHTFTGDFFSGPGAPSGDVYVAVGGIINVSVWGGVAINGFTHLGSGSISLHDVDDIGVDVGNVLVMYQNEWQGLATKTLRLFNWGAVHFESIVEVNPNFDPAVDFIIRSANDSFVFNMISARDAIGVGTTANTGIKASFAHFSTDIAGALRTVSAVYEANPTANSTADNMAIFGGSQSAVGNVRNFSFLLGGVFSATHNGSGTVSTAVAVEGAIFNASAGNITTAECFTADVVNSGAGTTAFGIGLAVHAPTVLAGAMTLFEGIFIEKPTAATFNASIVTLGGDVILNQTAGAASDLIVLATGDGFPANTTLYVNSATARVNVGGATPTLGKFQVSDTSTATTGSKVNSYSSFTVTPSAASDGNFTALLGETVAGGAFDVTGSVIGTGGNAYWTSATKTLTFLWGGQFQAILTAGGTVSDAEALRCRIQNQGSGTIANGSGLVIDTPVNSGGGAITSQIQLLIFESTVGGSNWSIYTTGGLVEFNANSTATGDFWIRGQTTTYGLYFDASVNYLGLGTNGPETTLHNLENWVLSGNVADTYSAAMTCEPGYSGTFTVDRHNYFNIKTPVAVADAPVITDACVFRFNANPGTHKAVDAGTTKTTPGGVDAWMKHNVNGTLYYSPMYLSKTT